MNYTYIIIDDNPEGIAGTRAVASRFAELQLVAVAQNYEDGLNEILEHSPAIVFLEIDPENKDSNLSLALVSELHRYFTTIPKIIITTTNRDLVFQACRYDILDYYLKPFDATDLRKTLLRLRRLDRSDERGRLESGTVAADFEVFAEKEIPVPEKKQEETESVTIDDSSRTELENIAQESTEAPIATLESKPLIICVKSYGDYRFIEAKDICYLQADNNSTDIHLNNGEMITAFKTLKHFEGVLSSPFVRIHNSYIVNIDYVSRIHTGNAVCYIKNTTTKLPFSKSYKENVDAIINRITTGNYLEI